MDGWFGSFDAAGSNPDVSVRCSWTACVWLCVCRWWTVPGTRRWRCTHLRACRWERTVQPLKMPTDLWGRFHLGAGIRALLPDEASASSWTITTASPTHTRLFTSSTTLFKIRASNCEWLRHTPLRRHCSDTLVPNRSQNSENISFTGGYWTLVSIGTGKHQPSCLGRWAGHYSVPRLWSTLSE